MSRLQIGDIVTRKSYGEDLYFKIIDIRKNSKGKDICVLRGMVYRIEADADMEDLLIKDSREALLNVEREMAIMVADSRRFVSPLLRPVFAWLRGRSGRILHVDSSRDFMQRCLDYYRDSDIRAMGRVVKESEQPYAVKRLLEQNRPDILVLTGHDSLKKSSANKNSLDSYSNSRYYIEAVKVARKYESDKNKLCIFAGACQSYFEALMEQGANFASSPGRILIHALDPAIISERVALTDSRKIVTPGEIVPLTKSGTKGIGGIDTRGFYVGR